MQPQTDNDGKARTARLLSERGAPRIHTLPPIAAPAPALPGNPRPLSSHRPAASAALPPLDTDADRAAAWQALVQTAPPEWWSDLFERLTASAQGMRAEAAAARGFFEALAIAPPGPGRRMVASGRRSPLKWPGGKCILARRIIPLMPAHHCYCEPFCGAAHVFFQKEPAAIECLNDINGELINFWNTLKNDPEEITHRHCWALHSRQAFNEWRDCQPEELDNAARAWRFWYLNQCSFGARCGAYGRTVKGGSRAAVFARKPAQLAAAHLRLQNVYVENLPYGKCIELYDSPATLFYLDPPYHGHEKDYGRGIFAPADFAALADQLKQIRGKFLLSINDCAAARQTFAGFPIVLEMMATYVVNRDRTVQKPELVFANFDPQEEIKKEKPEWTTSGQ